METVRLIGHTVGEAIIAVFVFFISVVLFIDHTVALVRGNTGEKEITKLLDRRIKAQVHTMLMESQYLESIYVKHVELKLKLIKKERAVARSIMEAEERMKGFINEAERNMYIALEPFLNDTCHTTCYVHEPIDYIEIGLTKDHLNLLNFSE